MSRTNSAGWEQANAEITCRVTQVVAPSESMMITDGDNFVVSYFSVPAAYNPLTQSVAGVAARHRGRANIAFFDLHVESLTGEKVAAQPNGSRFWRVTH